MEMYAVRLAKENVKSTGNRSCLQNKPDKALKKSYAVKCMNIVMQEHHK